MSRRSQRILASDGTSPSGSPGFALSRGSRRTSASDGASPSGSPGFPLPRASRRTSASDGTSPSGSPGFPLPQASRRTSASDGASPSGSPGFPLPRASQQTSASDGTSPSGSPAAVVPIQNLSSSRPCLSFSGLPSSRCERLPARLAAIRLARVPARSRNRRRRISKPDANAFRLMKSAAVHAADLKRQPTASAQKSPSHR